MNCVCKLILFFFPKEEHRTICDFTLVLQDLLCSYRNGKRCSEIVSPDIFLFLLKRGEHRNLLYVILLSVLAAVLLYKPFRVTGAL